MWEKAKYTKVFLDLTLSQLVKVGINKNSVFSVLNIRTVELRNLTFEELLILLFAAKTEFREFYNGAEVSACYLIGINKKG